MNQGSLSHILECFETWEIYIGLISMKGRKKCSLLNTFCEPLTSSSGFEKLPSLCPKNSLNKFRKIFSDEIMKFRSIINSQRMIFYQLFVYMKLFLLPIDPSRLVHFISIIKIYTFRHCHCDDQARVFYIMALTCPIFSLIFRSYLCAPNASAHMNNRFW